jgi:hypothetical protein
MTDSEHEKPPTFYANFVTLTLNTDELVMEFRRIDKPHRETMGLPVIPGATTDEVMRVDPIARVVMQFTSAKALHQYLSATLPGVEKSRKTGEPIK